MSAAVSDWSSGEPMARVQEVYLGCCLWGKQGDRVGTDGGGGASNCHAALTAVNGKGGGRIGTQDQRTASAETQSE